MNNFIKIGFIVLCYSVSNPSFGEGGDSFVNKKVNLKVCSLQSNKYKAVSEEGIRSLLSEAKSSARLFMGVDVGFNFIGGLDEEAVFRVIPRQKLLEKMRYSATFSGRVKNNEDGLKESIKHSFKRFNLQSWGEFYRPYVNHERDENDLDSIIKRMIGEYVILSNSVFVNNDGEVVKPLLSEWLSWESVGYANTGCDVIITNYPIISLEYYMNAIHVMLRGGINIGGVSRSDKGYFKPYIFYSLFPFISDAPALVKMRELSIEPEIMAGRYLSHELGHLLYGLNHELNKRFCFMRPVELLDFDNWYTHSADADRCQPIHKKEISTFK